MKTNNTVINSIMKNVVNRALATKKNSLRYLCAAVMMLGMSVNAWGEMHIKYGGVTYGEGSAIPIVMDLDGESYVYADDISLELTIDAPGWIAASGSGYTYGYMQYSCTGSNDDWYAVIEDGNSTYKNSSQYGKQYITIQSMATAKGTYEATLTIKENDRYEGTTLVSGTFTLRFSIYDSDASSCTVSFAVGYGSAPSSASGTSITLPAIPAVCSSAADDGWAPYGWATASVANNSSSASIVGVPGETYYPDADRTLYAVYKKGGTTLTASTGFTWVDSEKSTSNMPSNCYAILTQVSTGASSISNTINPTYSNFINTVTTTLSSTTRSTSDASCVWYISSPSTGVYTFKNLATGKYLGLSNTTTAALLDDGTSSYAKWTLESVSKNGFYFTNNGVSYTDHPYYLCYTADRGWRGSDGKSGGTSTNVYIYKQVEKPSISDAKYQSSLPACGFQVTYNGNGKNGGGNPPTDNTVYTSGATVTVLGNSNSMTKTGYTFSGWNTSPDGNGTDRAASSTFSITSDVTLYAKWVAKEYTINLNKDGGSGGSTSVTATYDAAMPSAGSAPTFSGYEFGGYYAEVGGGGTQYYNSTPASAHVWDVDANNSSIYAKWTQVVTLDKNEGAADKSVTVTYHGAGTSSFTAVTRDGYDCTGYWDATSDGNKIITDDGELVSYSAAVEDYINSSGKWCHSGATTLYAQWSAKTYTVTLNQGDGTGGSTGVTATYGSDMPSATMPTAPTGYTFAGYYYGETIYYNADGSSARAWDIAEETTLIARYTINTPTLKVASVDDVTITATPSEGDVIGENSSETVIYNTSVALAYTGLTANYYFEGWDVYETGNSGNKVTVSNNSFTMPNYHVTVSAIVRPNTKMKAWCPVITLEWTDGSTPILVTSVKDQSVKAVRTLHLTVTGAATPSAVVTLSGTDLEFYKSDGTKITSSNLTCSSYALDATIYVAYKPSGDYSDDNWNAPDITASCSSTDVIVSDLVHVRRLPDNGTSSGQGYVIAAKVGGDWYALPAAMSAGAQDGLPITVDDDEDPTEVTLAPTSARYNLYNVYTSSGVNDRHKVYGDYAYLAGSGSKVLKAASSGTNISLGVNASTYSGGSADAAYFEWLLSTTDKKNYTLTNNGRSAQLKYYTTHDKFGMYSYESSVITEFRLLPATFYTEAPMQVVEWKANSIVVMYTGSETTATTKVGNNDPSSSQTLANNKLTHGIYELTTDQTLTSNDGAALEISFGDGSTRKIVEVPIIITGNSTATGGHAAQDVVICDGGKLTAETTSYDYYNIYVYGGGKLDIPTGTSLGVNNIILRAGGLSTSGIGSSPSATYQYVYPQVGLIGTLTSAEANIQYEYITDYEHWYHFCLPFDGTLSTIHYPMEYYGDNVTEDNTGSWIVKRYAGEIRATGNYNAWVDIETESATAVTAGHGYIFWGAPKKISVGGDTKQRSKWGIQRIAMPIADFSTAASAEAANKTVSSLSSYSGISGNSGKNNDQGWNLIGNPYLVNLTGLNSSSIQIGQLVHTDTDPWDGKWVWDNTDPEAGGLRYVTIPDNHFDNYEAKTMAWFTAENPMKAGRTFFVQIAGANTSVVFTSAKRASLIPAWKLAQEPAVDIETGIVLSNETMEDEVNFWLKDGKTEAYEYNADYPKTMNNTNFNIYGVHSHGELSWVAISPEIAEGSMAIGYQVPAAGEYTLSLSETYVSDKIDALYVTDHAMSPEVTVDLMDDPYVFTVMQAETNDTRFTISIRLKEESPGTATDTEQIDTKSQQPQKFIYHEKMYILRGGVIYDATGKRVREINK